MLRAFAALYAGSGDHPTQRLCFKSEQHVCCSSDIFASGIRPPAAPTPKWWTDSGRIGESEEGRFRGPRHNALIFLRKLERAKRFELSTPTLARLCSTTELRPRS